MVEQAPNDPDKIAAIEEANQIIHDSRALNNGLLDLIRQGLLDEWAKPQKGNILPLSSYFSLIRQNTARRRIANAILLDFDLGYTSNPLDEMNKILRGPLNKLNPWVSDARKLYGAIKESWQVAMTTHSNLDHTRLTISYGFDYPSQTYIYKAKQITANGGLILQAVIEDKIGKTPPISFTPWVSIKLGAEKDKRIQNLSLARTAAEVYTFIVEEVLRGGDRIVNSHFPPLSMENRGRKQYPGEISDSE